MVQNGESRLLGFSGLGFGGLGIWGVGFGVWGLRDLGFGIQGLRFRAQQSAAEASPNATSCAAKPSAPATHRGLGFGCLGCTVDDIKSWI